VQRLSETVVAPEARKKTVKKKPHASSARVKKRGGKLLLLFSFFESLQLYSMQPPGVI
jgi:hypothetical protein